MEEDRHGAMLMTMSGSDHACSVYVPMPVYAEGLTWLDAYNCLRLFMRAVCVYRDQVYGGQTWYNG